MKRKNFIIGACTLFLSLSLSGCSILSNRTEISISAYEKIQKSLVEMETYQAAGTVKYISNKGANEYQILQQCRSTGEYRITVTGPDKVAGNVTVFDGTVISQFNPRVSDKISVGTKESAERSEILVTTFVKNYISSSEVSVTASAMDESMCTVLEATIPGDHQYLATEKLWINNETYKPMQLIVYDKGGSERIVVTFTEFEYNTELEDGVFKVN